MMHVIANAYLKCAPGMPPTLVPNNPVINPSGINNIAVIVKIYILLFNFS